MQCFKDSLLYNLATAIWGWHDIFVFVLLAIVVLAIGLHGGQPAWPAVFAMCVSNVVTMRIVFGGGFALTLDVMEHMDTSNPHAIKENVRSGWTNGAVVSALLLTMGAPLLQVSFDDSDGQSTIQGLYVGSAWTAVGFAVMGVVQPVYALVYTDHLSTNDTVKFLVCNPWTVGNPLLCIPMATLWFFVALSLWTLHEHGALLGAYAFCMTGWAIWNLLGSACAMSSWTPSTPMPTVLGGSSNPINAKLKSLQKHLGECAAASEQSGPQSDSVKLTTANPAL